MRRIFAAFLIVALLVGIYVFAAADEDRVYIATLSGAKFHIDRDCWGLEKAIFVSDVSMDRAYEHGYTPCKVCAPYLVSDSDSNAVRPSSADGVLLEEDIAYYAPDGILYHDKPDCVNLWYADEVLSDNAEYCAAFDMQHCPLCVEIYPEVESMNEIIVFYDPDDRYFHQTPECAHIYYGFSPYVIEAAQDDIEGPLTMCRYCFNRISPANPIK